MTVDPSWLVSRPPAVVESGGTVLARAVGFARVGEVDPGPDRPFQKTREAVWRLHLRRTPPEGNQ